MGGHQLSDLWPSARPSTGRATKAPKAGQTVPTNWSSACIGAVFAVLLAGLALAFIWPVMAQALDAIQQVTDALSATTRNFFS